MGKVNLDIKKVTFNFPVALMKEVEEFCKENTLPVTQGIHFLIRYGLDYHNMISNMPEMIKFMNTLDNHQPRKSTKSSK